MNLVTVIIIKPDIKGWINTNKILTINSEWADEKGYNQELHELTVEEVDEKFRLFYAEDTNKQGEEYSKNTLLGLRSGFERYLNVPPHNNKSFIQKI